MPTSKLSLLTALLVAAACAGSSQGAKPGSAENAPAGSTVTASEIERNPNADVQEVLKGRIAGVNVERSPDGGIIVRVRGSSTLQGNDAPLYLLDGQPIEPGPNGSIGINPYDIESIKVLKDPASLTMYGIRGANGVVVIKTKRRTQ
jgi:TonB-dependent SusC/RagA subfamily outer membrane receptor